MSKSLVNYYQSTEESAWPLRQIDRVVEIPNVYDYKGIAVKAYLECGHHCVLTGDAVYNRTTIHCKPCSEGGLHGNSFK